MNLKRIVWEGVNYTHLFANRDNKWAAVDKVIKKL